MDKYSISTLQSEIVNFSNIKGQHNLQLIEKLNQRIETSPGRIEELSIKLTELIKNPNLELFEILKSQLFQNSLSTSSEFHTLLTLYLLNTSLKLWSKNELRSNEVIGELYDYIFEKNVLSPQGKMTIIRFHNVIGSIASIKGELWCITFINKWINKVDTQNIEDTKHLAYAQVYFACEKYEEIEANITGRDFEIIEQKLRARL